MRLDEINAVQDTRLLRGMPEEARARLLEGGFLQVFPAHLEIVSEGNRPDFLHVLLDGQVELFAHYRDRENTISVIGPQSSFIVAAVMLDRPYLKSARLLTASRILLIPAKNVRRMFTECTPFAQSIAEELAAAFRGVVKELKNQKLRSTVERTAAWLIRRNEETGETGRFELPFEKRILAGRLGMAPEVLSRTFVTLRPYGVIVSGRTVTLKDPAGLRRLAAPDDLIDNPEP